MNDLSISIKEQDKKQVLKILNKRLDRFVSEISDIERKIKEEDAVHSTISQIEYNCKWDSTVKSIPIPHIDEHISAEQPIENLRMSTLYPKRLPRQTTYDKDLTKSIIDYVTYIYKKEGLPYSEIIKWKVLYVIGDIYDITSVTIPVKSVLKMVDEVVEDKHSIIKPTQCFWDDTLYDSPLSSSKKGALSRIHKLQRAMTIYIANYIRTHQRKHPHRSEVKSYLLEYIGNDSTLKSSYKSLNPRTMSKIMNGYERLLKK